MSRRNLTLLIVALSFAVLCRTRAGHSPHPRYVADAFDTIDQWAWEQPNRQELLEGAVRGMVDVLHRRGDRHSQYIDPRRAQPFLDEMRQEFGGVGVRIRLVGDPQRLLLVGAPEPNSPAAQAGVRPNDEVIEIDGHSVAGMTIEEVMDKIRGPRGAVVTLTVRHHGEEQLTDLRIVRDLINVPSVIGDRRMDDGSWRYRLEEDPRVALVRITNFGNKTVEELKDRLTQLLDQGVEAFVLDVRQNPGGALDAAVGVCDLLLAEGAPIVETRNRHGRVKDAYTASGFGLVGAPPIVVLVDGDSASASEIVAAALQDDGRAKVAGRRSFGKGTVQQIIPVRPGEQASYLKLTTRTYWRPSGKNIHRSDNATDADDWGVQPDPELRVPLDDHERQQWLIWRQARRDLTVFDAETGQVLSKPDLPADPEHEPLGDYVDPDLTRALEYLQDELDAGV